MSHTIDRLASALADRYRLEREIGSGGMATVYLAEDVRHHRKVAIKVLHAELSAILGPERFLKEIELTANLQHPHILPLFDSGSADGLLYYVMPFVDGESLRGRLNREKLLPISDAVRVATEVADALEYAHKHGVIHRDIKPENVLLHEGRALVADFGIALAVEQAGGTRMTQTGLSLGTPQYMSPEQAMGEREITARADIYSLGVVTYEMLSGDPPFTGSTAQAVVAQVITAQPRPLLPKRHTIPPHVEAAVLTALEKLPADRFPTAAEFADALAGRGFSSTLPSALHMTGSRRTDWRVLVAVAVVALGVGAGIGRLWPRPPALAALGRFEIRLAPVTSFGNGSGPEVALSPNGKLLAFVGRGARGDQIFLRAMDDTVPRPVRGTDGGSGPFFSPDGRQIGFWTPQKLQRVPIEGGAPTLIADSASYFATWTVGGAVVYEDENNRTLRIVEANGTRRDIVRSDSVRFQDLTAFPDGRAVLATELSGGRNRSSIVAISLRDGAMHDIGLPDAIMARYIASGQVVYQRRLGGPLLAAPFDLKRLLVNGESRPVAPEARLTFGMNPQWDAVATSIIYEPLALSELIIADRSGHRTMLEDELRNYHHPRFSSDGRRVALDISEPGSRDVWIVDVGDGQMTRLTVGENANDPFWSPDGRQLAYSVQRGGIRSVVRRNADGSGSADSVYADANDHSSGSWAPDGRSLVSSTSLSAGLWTVPLDGSGRASALSGSRRGDAHPAFSPDGHWLAYVSDESGRQEVYVRSYPGPSGRIQISAKGGSEPVWTHDGRELFYREDSGWSSRLIAAKIRQRPVFAVLTRTPLFDVSDYLSAEDHANYDVSPDGRTFVMIRNSRAEVLQLVQNWETQLGKP